MKNMERSLKIVHNSIRVNGNTAICILTILTQNVRLGKQMLSSVKCQHILVQIPFSKFIFKKAVHLSISASMEQ